MTLDAKGPWSFILTHRGVRLAALITVAYAIAVSTVLFQTLTGNRILTPAVMGFDALFLLLQTSLVAALGGAGAGTIDPRLLFAVECLAMVGLSGLLFRLLFRGEGRNLPLVVLSGMLFGGTVPQPVELPATRHGPQRFPRAARTGPFASFNVVDPALIGVAALLAVAATIIVLPRLAELDVLVLGRDRATGLGVDTARPVGHRLRGRCRPGIGGRRRWSDQPRSSACLVANLAYLLIPSAPARQGAASRHRPRHRHAGRWSDAAGAGAGLRQPRSPSSSTSSVASRSFSSCSGPGRR